MKTQEAQFLAGGDRQWQVISTRMVTESALAEAIQRAYANQCARVRAGLPHYPLLVIARDILQNHESPEIPHIQ